MRGPICNAAELKREPVQQALGGLLSKRNRASCPNREAEAEEFPNERLSYIRILAPYALPIGRQLDSPTPLAQARDVDEWARRRISTWDAVAQGDTFPCTVPPASVAAKRVCGMPQDSIWPHNVHYRAKQMP